MFMILCFDNWRLSDIYYPGSTAVKMVMTTDYGHRERAFFQKLETFGQKQIWLKFY